MSGFLCISIDVELAWGTWDTPRSDVHDHCARSEKAIVRALVEMFTAHEVSATWAIVGRLLELDEAKASTSAHGASIWYAPDLVELIRAAPVPQEIGSHGYAHIYFGQSSPAALRADLAAARRVHERHGLPFASFVFPRNQVAHVELLRESGVQVFRGVDRGWHMRVRDRFGTQVGRVAHLADKLLPIAPASVRPAEDRGLVELPGSMLLMGREGPRRVIPPAMTIAKARRGLEAAHRNGETFHLWFHPSNFYVDMQRQLDSVAEILRVAGKMRAAGQLDVRTMGSFASS